MEQGHYSRLSLLADLMQLKRPHIANETVFHTLPFRNLLGYFHFIFFLYFDEPPTVFQKVIQPL